MEEKILKIEEGKFKNKSLTYEGFVITTNKQEIRLGITDGWSCCEDSGYFMTNDNISEFIGAKIISINIVDDQLKKRDASTR